MGTTLSIVHAIGALCQSYWLVQNVSDVLIGKDETGDLILYWLLKAV